MSKEADALDSDWGTSTEDPTDLGPRDSDTNEPETDDTNESNDWGVTDNLAEEDGGEESNTSQSSDELPDIEDVRETVLEHFDERFWNVTEAVLSTQATLLFDGLQGGAGLVIVGASGSGKTTALKFIQDSEYQGKDLVYRSDDMTHASLVSHDASLEEEEVGQNDLLPKIRHRVLLNRDLNPWFSGNYENIRKRMSYLAVAMDGEGLTRDTGAQGGHGYEGDYRFVIAGATTPLESRAWDAMGNVGNRLLFHEMPREEDINTVIEDVFDDVEVDEKVEACRSHIKEFIGRLWKKHGGYASVNWEESTDEEVKSAIGYLSNLISHTRAPLQEVGNQQEPQIEGWHRVMSSLRNLARGHALICGRNKLNMNDVEVCARVAVSTMHKERRGIVRAVVDPDTDNPITSREVTEHSATSASHKTLQKRMDLLQVLGLGDVTRGDSGRDTKQFILDSDFVWPDGLQYPRFWE